MQDMNERLGIYVALITAFTEDDRINGIEMTKLMERNLKEGAAGFFVGGSSAECFLLSHEERLETFEIGSSMKDRTNLIAHVGALSTKEAIGFAKEAKRMGYQQLAATPPYYYGYSSKDICRYYYELSQAVDMPIVVYNFPGNTHREFDLTNPDYIELFTSPAIGGVKHTNQVVFQMERLQNLNPSLKIYDGFDETMICALAYGITGAIGSTFNCMLPHYQKLYDAFFAGNIKKAQELQHSANTIMAAFCKVGLIPAVKYVLETQGIQAGNPRSPFAPLGKDARDFIDETLKQYLVK